MSHKFFSLSVAAGITGSFTGSLIGSASAATSASYATVTEYNNIAGKPSGLISSSMQFSTGSYTGSFTGSLLGNASTTTSASYSTSASFSISSSRALSAITASYISGNIDFPNGLVITGSVVATSGFTGSLSGSATSASAAVSSSYALTASYALNGGSGSSVSASYATTSSFLLGNIASATSASYATSASFALALDGFVSFPSGLVITGSVIATSFSGSYSGSISNATSASYALTASYVSGAASTWDTITGKPAGLVSSSLQISTGSFTGSFTGSLLGNASTATSASYSTSASAAISASFAGAIDGFVSFPSGLVITGSIIATSFTGSYSGSISTAVSSSYAATASLLLGSVSSASYALTASYAENAQTTIGTASWATSASWAPGGVADWDTLLNRPANVVSSSAQTILNISSSIAGITGSGLYISGNVAIGDNEHFNADPTLKETLYITSSTTRTIIGAHSNYNNYVQINNYNTSNGATASADFIVTNDSGSETFGYADFGINNSQYASAFVGNAHDGYLYVLSAGQLHIGNASTGSTANIKIFAGGANSDNNSKIFISSSGEIGFGNRFTAPRATVDISGSIKTMNALQYVSGTFVVANTNTGSLDLAKANYFIASASAPGTVTWTVSNAAPSGTLQGFILRYSNGGAMTNTWFANTRWPGGVAPTLTSGGVDLIGWSSDDGGSNWRGALLQRDSK